MDKVRKIEVISVRGLVLMPNQTVRFDIGRQSSRKAVKNALLENNDIFIVCQRDIEKDNPVQSDLYEIGTIAQIVQLDSRDKGVLSVVVRGVQIAKLEQYIPGEVGTVLLKEEEDITDSLEAESYRRNLLDLMQHFLGNPSDKEARIYVHLESIQSVSELVFEIVQHLNMQYDQKQRLLAAAGTKERAELLGKVLSDEIAIRNLRYEISMKMRTSIDEKQKQSIYREQIRVLKKELGEDDDNEIIIEKYEEALKALDANEEVKDKISKEIQRLKTMSSYMSEANVVQDYVETMLAMPWNKTEKENKDIRKAEDILEKDHYGLEEIKKRVVEYLAVHMHSKNVDAPILCLVGPPGTGKTSIAKSIARALHRKYERISLGGVYDEAELRGHRKTYVGAMPGRIATALMHVKTSNPVLLLDEIDKMGTSQRGDISSAMLEVLDGEQNSTFRDHYLEVPLDLSRVFFIATANSVDTIPKPLLDRMEIIEVGSYLEDEKYEIARQYLIPKQLKKHGLSKKQLTFQKNGIYEIIRGYTREAGVRNLERNIAGICRKAVTKYLEEQTDTIKISKKNVNEYLGMPKYYNKSLIKQAKTGLVHGLAWTTVGGDTLDVEAIVLPGDGKITFTGNMGDVMKESAQLAGICVRSQLQQENIAFDLKNKDIHLHIPEGAVPKDGPSAGITMATAIYSAITGKPVDYNLAMTGEISLLGEVLPIGGLKEKLVAAKARNIKKVLVPAENEKDVSELPKIVLDQMEIHYVSSFKEVLKWAIV